MAAKSGAFRASKAVDQVFISPFWMKFAPHVLELKPLTSMDGWEISGTEVIGIDPSAGLKSEATVDVVTIFTASNPPPKAMWCIRVSPTTGPHSRSAASTFKIGG